MRTWFWTLLLAAVAVALAVVLQSHTGNVIILVPPHRIELSFTLVVLIIVGSFVALYVGLRVLAWLLAIPSRVRDWRGRRAQARDHELMEDGWVGLLEGRFSHAEKKFGKLIIQTRVESRRAVAALSAARAAQHMGEFTRRDTFLSQAREAAGDDPGLIEAVATVSADMFLDQGKPAEALAVLAPSQDGGARHWHTTRLLLRAENELGHHDQVFTLARTLGRRHALAKPEAERLIDTSGAARLRAGSANGDGWRLIWKDMKSAERTYPEIALAGSQAFDAAGEPEEAARILEAAIARQFSPSLVAAYARCEASQVKRRIERAEGWLAQRPNDPDLLRVLGLLCLTGQIWGAAERYLTRSLKYRSDPQTHALLGSLYDRLNRPEEAARHWRMATAVGMALPTLAGDAALPAADTNADPRYAAAEVADLDDVYAAQGFVSDGDDLSPAVAVVPFPGSSALDGPVSAGGFNPSESDYGFLPEDVSTADAYPGRFAKADISDADRIPPTVRSSSVRPVVTRTDAPPAHEVTTVRDIDADDYFDSAPPLFDGLDDTGRTDRNSNSGASERDGSTDSDVRDKPPSGPTR